MIKLGPHALFCNPVDWFVLKPTVIKLCYDLTPAASIPEEILVVGRPDENYIGNHPVGEGDPLEKAKEFFQIFESLIKLFPRIDVWEGPNEYTPESSEKMSWYAYFLEEFAYLMSLVGKRALIGSFATGTISPELWKAYVPALQACDRWNAIHCRHVYGPLDIWNTYRFEEDQRVFNSLGFHPDIILSECGADVTKNLQGDVIFRPWRLQFGNDFQRYYNEWIKPFINRINQLPYVVGATLFTWGTGFADAWKPFNVSDTNIIEQLNQDKDLQMPDNIAVAAITVTSGVTQEAAQADVYDSLNQLAFKWSKKTPAKVLSLPEAGHRTMLFSKPGDTAPKFWRPDWDMNVTEQFVDTEGVVWYKVNNSPPMWVLKAHVKPKP